MKKLFKYQENIIKEMTEEIKYLLEDLKRNRTINKDLYFVSPTGSGKTIMSFEIISKITENVLIIWVAPNKLENQSFEKYNENFNEDNSKRIPLKINENFTSNNINDIVRNPENHILFINWASINKEDNILLRDNETKTNLPYLFKTLKDNNIPVLFFIDEAHIGTEDKKYITKAQEILNKYSNLNIKISATIDEDNKVIKKVNYKEVVEEGVISKLISFNEDVYSSDTEHILEKSIEKLNELKNLYENEKINVNPLLLIQLENNTNGINDQKDIVEKICLDNGIKKEEIGIYLSEENNIPNNVSFNLNPIRVIISKVAIATGWDCPRAQILCGLRDINSNKLPVQTLGRIIRMPELHHYENELLNIAYVYTNTDSFEKSFDKKPEGCLKTKNIQSEIKENLIFSLNKYKRIDIEEFIEISTTNTIKNIVPKYEKDFILEELEIGILKGKIDNEFNLDELHTEYVFLDNEKSIIEKYNKFIFMLLSNIFPKQNKLILKKDLEQYIKEKTDKDFRLIMLNNEKVLTKIINEFKINNKFNEDEFKTSTFKEDNLEKWKIPERIDFCDNSIIIPYKKSIHQPFYNNCNKLEIEYIETLEKDKNVKWWFKNGDNGNQYFSIPYYDINTFSIRQFYPDFIVVMEDDSILITETKGTHLTTNLESIKKKEYFLYYENIEYLNNISVKWID